MKKDFIPVFLCLIFSTTLFAQKTEEGLDAFLKPSATGWRYYAITEKKGDLWYREVYYLPEKSMATSGTYKDKDCKIAEGNVVWWHENKNPKSSINYKDGRVDGIAFAIS